MCCAELSLSCVGHRRGQWGWPGRAGRQLSLATAASCRAPLLNLGGIKLWEAAMCHQGPTASHFKSVNLLFFKLVTLALLSSYTTLNGRSSGRRDAYRTHTTKVKEDFIHKARYYGQRLSSSHTWSGLMYWLTISSMISSVYSWNMKSGLRLEDISLLYYIYLLYRYHCLTLNIKRAWQYWTDAT